MLDIIRVFYEWMVIWFYLSLITYYSILDNLEMRTVVQHMIQFSFQDTFSLRKRAWCTD